MIEKFECEGYWWLPEHPKMQVSGTLRYNQQEGVVLEVFDIGEEFLDLFRSSSKTILGLSQNTQRITLYNCQKGYNEQDKSSGGLRTNIFDIDAEIALIGGWFEDQENTLKGIKKLRVSLSYLQKWIWISGFDDTRDYQENSVKIEYNNPNQINMG